MLHVFFIIFISLIFENILNVNLSYLKYFIPLFTLLSLIFIYQYLKKEPKKYYVISLSVGLVYDLFFTNFYVLNSLLFLISAFFIKYILEKYKYKLSTIIFTTIFIVFLYNFLLFCLLNFFRYIDYNLLDLSFILKYFILGNVLYSLFMYLILKFINHNHINS